MNNSTTNNLNLAIAAPVPIVAPVEQHSPLATPSNDEQFFDRLGVEVICLIFCRTRLGKILLRRTSDGELYRRPLSRLSSMPGFLQIFGERVYDCISPFGRVPGTYTLKRAREAIFYEACKRIWDERELRQSGVLDEEGFISHDQ